MKRDVLSGRTGRGGERTVLQIPVDFLSVLLSWDPFRWKPHTSHTPDETNNQKYFFSHAVNSLSGLAYKHRLRAACTFLDD